VAAEGFGDEEGADPHAVGGDGAFGDAVDDASEFGEDDDVADDFVAVADADVVEVNMRRTGIGDSAEVGVRTTITICGLHQANVGRPRGSGSLIQPLQIVIRPRPPASPPLPSCENQLVTGLAP
jgi:hypothetical protein